MWYFTHLQNTGPLRVTAAQIKSKRAEEDTVIVNIDSLSTVMTQFYLLEAPDS